MGCLNSSMATNQETEDPDVLIYKSNFLNDINDNKVNNLKILNRYILELSNNIEKYLKLPLKELLLLINIIELDDNKENINSLLEELKKYIKLTIENCNDILQHRFDIIEKNINSSESSINVSSNPWNSKLFIESALFIDKICQQKKISLTNEKFFLCITEIYNYFNRLAIELDPKFISWFIEKFLYNNDDYLVL